ncbi:MAG: amidohydrolase family protein [Myxococcales bacterium]|nr:amidohydrolase family protein [Myxococcales bacterium]
MNAPNPGSPEWLALVDEDVIDPERPIVDPHHHLWPARYGLDELLADTGSGHRIEKTVFIECHASYRSDGPEHLRPVGETEFVAQAAAKSAAGPGATIAAIVAHADLRLGDKLEEALDAHAAAGQGLFRGIRHAGAHAGEHASSLLIAGRGPAGLYADTDFRAGVRRLGERGLCYDTWHYHFQNRDFLELARAVPNTTLVLDHFGTPLGVGPFADQRPAIFEQWKKDIAEIASCPNVIAKLGGLAMPDNGFGWNTAPKPPSSDEFVEAQAPYYLHTLECFGAERCMMESNFPVDRMSLGYRVLWNGLKKIVAGASETEKQALFSGTATRVYRLEGSQ